MTSLLTYAALLRSLESSEPVPCQEFANQQGPCARDSRAVFERAFERGAQLLNLGLVAGDRVGIVVTDPSQFLPLVHGCLLFGLVAVPMYPPSPFSRLDTYRATLTTILRVAKAKVVVTDDTLRARVGDWGSPRVLELSELDDVTVGNNIELPDVEPADLALLQFTSGSTSEPRGVRISHGALMANARAIMVDGLAATPADRGVSWLPLFHDMGLIGFGLAPLLTRTPVTFIPTARFVRSPIVWLQTLADTRGTITFAPNFAYALAIKRAAPDGLDLSSVRMWGCGAEPISERVLSDFEMHFAANGVKPKSVSPCYGLAEATLAVTFTPPGGPRISLVMHSALWETEGTVQLTGAGDASGPVSETLAISCGRPLPGYVVQIVDEAGCDVGERRAGEIVVTGPSLGLGYEATEAASGLAFGEMLRTGDRGFMHQGQLFVTGRIKDTLIANGRKYDPHVLEHCAEQVNGVRRAAAVNVESNRGDVLVLLVECGSEAGLEVDEMVRARVAADVGVAVDRVMRVAPGALPRTTSGKIRRSAAKLLARSAVA